MTFLPMFTASFLLLQSAAAPQATEQRLMSLAHRRQDFDDRVVLDRRYDLEDHIYSMPLDQHVQGYYPVGVSDRHYLVYQDIGAQSILFQKIQSGRARTLWCLALRKGPGSVQFPGTLGKMIHLFGSHVEGKTTAAERASLTASEQFAAYEKEGISGDDYMAWLVRGDGTSTPVHYYHESKILPIVDGEAAALGLGKVSWPHNMPFEVR